MDGLKELEEHVGEKKVLFPDLSEERVFSDEIHVKALFDPVAKWRLIEEFGPKCFTAQTDGKLLFEENYTSFEHLVSWILSFGNQLEVLEPSEGDFLRQQYEDIIPGYYMNKVHWNSVKPDGEVSDELLKDLLEEFYELVLGGFSKKKQREIIGLSCCGTDCLKCSFYGNMCQGYNESCGKVFHAPKGKECPIYECAESKLHYC